MQRQCTILLLASLSACATCPSAATPDFTSLHPVGRSADTVTACLEGAVRTRAEVAPDGSRTIRYRDRRGRVIRTFVVTPDGGESMVHYRKVQGTKAPSPLNCLAIEAER